MLEWTGARFFLVKAGLALLISVSYCNVAEAEVRSPGSVCVWEKLNWSDMSAEEQRLWSELGWTQANWDGDTPEIETASEAKGWDELSEGEKRAAAKLGYDQYNWEVACSWD